MNEFQNDSVRFNEIAQLEKLQKDVASILSYLEKSTDKLRGIAKQISLGDEDSFITHMNELSKVQLNLRKKSLQYYRDLGNIGQSYHSKTIVMQEKSERNNGVDRELFDAWIDDGVIYLKLPLLHPKAILWNNYAGKHFINHFNYFDSEIHLLLSDLMKNNRILFQNRRYKTITYLFVYSPDMKPMDADNHDTKGTTDSICEFFPGGDEAYCCSMFYISKQSNEVPSSTIIAITEGDERPYYSEAMIKAAKFRKIHLHIDKKI